jgi:general nucleoside transport system permease protein
MLSDLLHETIVVSILAATVRIATPILIAALGEMITERAGVYNMGLEGTMLTGAFAGFFVAFHTGSPALGIAAAALAGALGGLLLAFLTVSLRVEQIVTGLAVNLLASGLTTFLFKAAFRNTTPAIAILDVAPVPGLAAIPYLGPILFQQKPLTYFGLLAVPALWVFLYRTRLGLEIRCIGINAKALDTKGRSVHARQYGAVMFGSMMAAVGGSFLTVGSASQYLPDMTNGRGWLAIIIVIAGGWRPGAILLAALAFAFLDALQLQIQGVGFRMPFQLLLALPYIAAIVALALYRTKVSPPAMLGIPYSRE